MFRSRCFPCVQIEKTLAESLADDDKRLKVETCRKMYF